MAEPLVRRAPFPVRLLSFVSFLLLYLPLVAMVFASFVQPASTPGEPGTWTLKWYRELLSKAAVWDAFYLSVIVAFWSTFISTILGTLAALGIRNQSKRLRQAFESLAVVPIVMPEILLGLSLLVWFVFIRISLGATSIILAHVTFSVSYVFMSVQTRLQNLDPALDEAAKDLGATAWQTFLRVRLPLLWPGIYSGALMAFTLSFDDFLITFFTSGVDAETLPIHIYSMIRYGVAPETNALSSLLLLLTFLVVTIFTAKDSLEAPYH